MVESIVHFPSAPDTRITAIDKRVAPGNICVAAWRSGQLFPAGCEPISLALNLDSFRAWVYGVHTQSSPRLYPLTNGAGHSGFGLAQLCLSATRYKRRQPHAQYNTLAKFSVVGT